METKVMIPSPAVDFNFDSACTSPYTTAPSSPQQRLRNFFIVSAPTSPTRGSAFYHELRDGGYSDGDGGSPSAIPFKWEEKPGTPKRNRTNVGGSDYDLDFAFNFSGQLETASLSADELFDGGKIKPLKPPPRLQFPQGGSKMVNESPKSPRKMIKEALSPRHRRKEFDPFAAAIEQTRNGSTQNPSDDQIGRERAHNSSRSSVRHKVSRSLSPFRVSDVLFEQENNQQNSKNTSSSSSSVSSSSAATGFSFSNWHRKWNLLFRNASDGRADSEKSKLTRYSEDMKNSSFRSIDSVGSSTSSSRRRGPPVSAHEKHYTVTRAASEELRKRSFLPYRRGLLGCLGFNSAINDISRGLNSSSRG